MEWSLLYRRPDPCWIINSSIEVVKLLRSLNLKNLVKRFIVISLFAAVHQNGYASELDSVSTNFELRTQGFHNTKECFPLHMENIDSVNTLYLYCSKIAFEQDGLSKDVSENFSISSELARRFNFWKRIYSLWSEDQYVLHIANYPEVVLEIADVSDLDAELHWSKKQKRAYKILKERKKQYKQVLKKMHALRTAPEHFSPTMKRIAANMKHIDDSNKYRIAANSIRTQRGQRDPIAKGLANSTRYMDILEAIFESEGIPKELAKIAFIESSFNLKAHSKVGASGVYQLMPGTAKQFKLKVTKTIDERRDPVKSARAAAKLLKENFRILKQWPLAITAYNHGAYGLKKAIRKTHSSRIEDLIENYNSPSFGFASKNFYAGYLAILATLNKSEQVFPNIVDSPPLIFTEVKLKRTTKISSIRKQYSLTNETIKDFNPDLSNRFLRYGSLPRNYLLKIPVLNTNTAQSDR